MGGNDICWGSRYSFLESRIPKMVTKASCPVSYRIINTMNEVNRAELHRYFLQIARRFWSHSGVTCP